MKHVTYVCLGLFIIFLLSFAAVAQEAPLHVRTVLDEPNISPETLAQLMARGQLHIVREDPAGRLQMITSGILIDRPPADVYRTVVDYAHYTDFMPSTALCEVVDDRGDVKDVRYKVRFKFLIFSFTVDYVLRTWFEPERKVTWNLLSCKGDKLRKTFGTWQFIPVANGTKTAAFYSVYSDISNVVPGLATVIRKEPSMEVAINVSTCVVVLKAVKKRSENPNWTIEK